MEHSSALRRAAIWSFLALALIAVPILPDVHRQKWVRWFGKKTCEPRMHVVGLINRVSEYWLGLKVLSPGATSIVSIMWVSGIRRVNVLIGKQKSGLKECLMESPSQMGQDALALILNQGNESNFFVEAGACDGRYSSNTWLLESRCNWTGILCEPGQIWHEELIKSRSCQIDTRALWSTTGEQILFHQTELPNLSTIDSFTDVDMHADDRRGGLTYSVETVSLVDLLDEKGAPHYIQFLSLDTEGTELAILQNFPFERYEFGVIVCEHNNTAAESLIRDLLVRNGYTYLDGLRNISLGDAWFVGPKTRSRLNDQLRLRNR